MMTAIRWFAICLLAAALAGCGSSRKAAAPKGGHDMTAEEYIFSELMLAQGAQPSFTRMLMKEAYSWVGTPYRYGGKSKTGTDCSGFVMEAYRISLGISLPRNSAKQAEACRDIKRSELRPGDLVFFFGGKSKAITHVGLYVGNNKMLHASGSRGVMESDIREDYFKKRFHHAGRVLQFESMLKKEEKFITD